MRRHGGAYQFHLPATIRNHLYSLSKYKYSKADFNGARHDRGKEGDFSTYEAVLFNTDCDSFRLFKYL